ncbi:MAG TPA: isochorismatase family protein [Solirubrobacteraceae bacterium]|nr:isochorismatase family protein [Solirubrobacteraceae bacterium]
MSRALIIVDVQRDFLPGGPLGVPDGDAVIGRINELLRGGDYDVALATRDWHPQDHSSFSEQGGPWPAHCVQGTPGAELSPELDHERIDAVVDKGADRDGEGYSAFETGELGNLLRTERVTELTITGLATDYCVAATARDALREGFLVTIDRAGVRGIDAEGSERALSELEGSGAVLTG